MAAFEGSGGGDGGDERLTPRAVSGHLSALGMHKQKHADP